MRYQLTETQKQSLGNAQIQLNQAQQQHQIAQDKLNEITALLFDAHGLDIKDAAGCEIDINTWELITPEIEGSDIEQTPKKRGRPKKVKDD